MKHIRADYNKIQDLSIAQQLARMILVADPVNKVALARQLAEIVLITETPSQVAIARRLAAEVMGRDSRGRKNDAPLVDIDFTQRLIPWNEPVFLLRGQDQLSGDAVRGWVELARAAGVQPEMIQMASRQAYIMDAWTPRKLPDIPVEVIEQYETAQLVRSW